MLTLTSFLTIQLFLTVYGPTFWTGLDCYLSPGSCLPLSASLLPAPPAPHSPICHTINVPYVQTLCISKLQLASTRSNSFNHPPTSHSGIFCHFSQECPFHSSRTLSRYLPSLGFRGTLHPLRNLPSHPQQNRESRTSPLTHSWRLLAFNFQALVVTPHGVQHDL